MDNGAKIGKEEKLVVRLLSREPKDIDMEELLALKQVRSIQISKYGIFSYPFFKCKFKDSDGILFFEKTTGSQRKSGFVFPNTDDTLVFLGASTVNDEPQRTYTGFNKSNDKSYDVTGLFLKKGKTILAIFAKSPSRYEIYEFK